MKAKKADWLACGSLALAVFLGTHAHAQDIHPADAWEFGVEAGYLAKVRNNSPHSYRIAASQAVWRSPALFDLWTAQDGRRLTVRNRFSVVGEAIVRGPESRYIAIAGSPTLELWSRDRRTAGFFEIGGGVGFINSTGTPGGQGQELTFNWFTQAGVRRQLDKDMALTAGLYFTHHSNLGMTNPNPGIDVLGLNFGLMWRLK